MTSQFMLDVQSVGVDEDEQMESPGEVKRIHGFASSEGRLAYCLNVLSPLNARLYGILCPQVILLHV